MMVILKVALALPVFLGSLENCEVLADLPDTFGFDLRSQFQKMITKQTIRQKEMMGRYLHFDVNERMY
jgi:hypothetical protein